MSLQSLLNQWDKAHFTDDTFVYNLRDFSNDIKDIMPALNQDSFYLDETILDDTSDWNNLSPNTFAYAKTFGGKNTPKISGSGFVMNLVSDTYSLQIAYSGSKIAVRFNQGDWANVSDGNNTDVINLLKDYAKKSDISDMTQYIKCDPDTGVASQNINFTGNINKNGVAIADTDDLKHLVIDNKDNTITANNLRYDLSKTGITPLDVYRSGSFNDLPLGTVLAGPPMTDGPDTIHSFTTTTFFSREQGGRKAQIAIVDNTNLMYFRVESNSSWNSWTLLSDDSKVAHLSGKNNFDTVPTVNNNPLLTAKTPGIPKLAVNYNAGKKAFDYALTAPEKDGLSDIIQYNLLWKNHGVDDWTTVTVKPDSLTGQLTGVGINKKYDFKASAQNAVGASGFTDVITLGTAVAPGIPKLAVKHNAHKIGFDYTVTAPESDGGSEITGYSLEYQTQGGVGWAKVTLKPNSLTGTVTDGIEVGNNYLFRVNAENAVGSSNYFTISDPLPAADDNIYGVSWDGSSSGTLQRTDAAVGLQAGINGAQNDFDTRGPWGLMDKTVTDSYGNAFVRVPKFYIRKTQNGTSTWQVSLIKQSADWYLPNCFYDFDNKKELAYVDVSRYEGSVSSDKLQSISGATPTANQSITSLRSLAVANNTDGKKGYHLWDVHTLDTLQILFTIEFATLDSQSIMKGVTDNVLSGAENTGSADGVEGSSGNVDHSNGYGSMTYRGIENLYGNLAMWTDGLNITNLSLYSCDDATKYVSDTFTDPYYMLNYSLPAYNSGNTNITSLGFDKGHPSVEAPTSYNSDNYNTYYHDEEDTTNSGNYVVYTGGGWDWGAGGSGLWCWYGDCSSAGAGSAVGSRLLKKAL